MTEQVFLPEEYAVVTKAGEPYRLLPFGALVKNGKRRLITPEYAAKFRLPHFKPPIKLGSHDDRTPAGGQIIGLEVRADGLYAIPELTEKGEKSLVEGDYRYHSPEIVWEGGALEDPTTGAMIEGPLIVGDALLHTPHLGEAAALYSVYETYKEDKTMTENIEVPKSLWERFTAWLDKRTAEPEEPPATTSANEPDKYEAVQKERDDYKAKLDALEAEKARAELLGAIVTRLQDKEKFGAMYVELKTAEEAAGMLASMTEEQREWCMRNFGALVSKIDTSALYSERGSEGEGQTDPAAQLMTAITAVMDERKVNYQAAFEMVRVEKPELLAAAYPVGGKK